MNIKRLSWSTVVLLLLAFAPFCRADYFGYVKAFAILEDIALDGSHQGIGIRLGADGSFHLVGDKDSASVLILDTEAKPARLVQASNGDSGLRAFPLTNVGTKVTSLYIPSTTRRNDKSNSNIMFYVDYSYTKDGGLKIDAGKIRNLVLPPPVQSEISEEEAKVVLRRALKGASDRAVAKFKNDIKTFDIKDAELKRYREKTLKKFDECLSQLPNDNAMRDVVLAGRDEISKNN